MIVGGDFALDQDENQLNLVEGGDSGSYLIKITPNVRLDISTLQLDVKTYYCAAKNTPRSRFFDQFTPDAYEKHLIRLLTLDKTVEELDEEDANFIPCGGKNLLFL
jgi:hypothetical protein